MNNPSNYDTDFIDDFDMSLIETEDIYDEDMHNDDFIIKNSVLMNYIGSDEHIVIPD